MELITPEPGDAQPVERYRSGGAAVHALAHGTGEAHVYAVHFEPGGEIGVHPAGYAQLFWVVSGAGWVSGGDGARVPLVAGQGALFRRGEEHAKGSETGMTAIMIQVADLDAAPPGE